jgi:hypothetical protein
MGFPTKVQLIKRKASEQWYINFPAAVAQAMEFQRGEIVEWIVEDRGQMVLRRRTVPPSAMKKKRHAASSTPSTPSGTTPSQASGSGGSASGRGRSR